MFYKVVGSALKKGGKEIDLTGKVVLSTLKTNKILELLGLDSLGDMKALFVANDVSEVIQSSKETKERSIFDILSLAQQKIIFDAILKRNQELEDRLIFSPSSLGMVVENK